MGYTEKWRLNARDLEEDENELKIRIKELKEKNKCKPLLYSELNNLNK